MTKFEINKTYTARCFGDHELVDKWEITNRTKATVKAWNEYEGEKTFRIKIIDGVECIKVAEGFSYLRADKVA